MKKTHTILAITAGLIVTLTSCTNPLMKDPRLYNKKQDLANSVPAPTEEPEIEAPSDFQTFDLVDAWFNNPDCNGDETSKDKVGFSNTEFDNMAITGWFSNQNVPTYKMYTADVWGSCKDTVRNEYVHSGAPDTKGQGFTINGVTYFQYRGKNPCYAGDGGYNTMLQKTAFDNPLLSRFYFYRFTGKGGGIQWLDNFLIAVDTYSKFVFAFSEPVSFSSMGAPTAWAATDRNKYNGNQYQFYMYDPVGYIVKNPDNTYSVELYKWFQDNLAAGNYKGSINSSYTAVAQKNKSGAGKSPFLSEISKADLPFLDKVEETTFSYREKAKGLTLPNFDTDGQGFGEILNSISFSKDGKEVTFSQTPWEGSKNVTVKGTTTAGGEDKNVAIYTINGESFTFETDTEATKISIYRTKDLPQKQDSVPAPEATETEKNTEAKSKEVAAESQKDTNTQDSSIIKPAPLGVFYRNFADKGPTFERKVKGHTYGYREADGYEGTDGQGYGFNLYTIKFNEDKTTETKTTNWKGIKTADPVSGTLTPLDDFLKAKVNVKELTISNDGKSITEGNKIYYKDFDKVDKGPSFANRVSNDPFYKGTKPSWGIYYDYQFIEGYKKLKVNDDTYDFVEFRNERNAAVYKKPMLGSTWYYGVELTPNTKVNDGLIRMTDGAKWIKTIIWDTKGSDAIRDDTPITDVLNNFNDKTFFHRPADDTNGYTNGELLYKYKFSNSGMTLKVTSENYTTKEVKDIETYVFDSRKGNCQDNYKCIYKDSVGNEVELLLSRDYKTITLDGNQYFDSDPGPDFLIRVKGKTFEGNNYRYIFNETGKTIKYKKLTGLGSGNWKEYSFIEQHSSKTAVYNTNEKYWGIRIAEDNKTIYWSSSYLLGPDKTLTNTANSNSATLQKK